jgi:hypothetical protein
MGWRKFAAATETLIPEDSSEEHVGNFFEWQGVMHKEFVLKGQTVNSELYIEVMDQLLKKLWHVMLKKAQSRDWFTLHYNAPSHNATIIKPFLTKKSVTVLYHPHYSPDLAPANHFIFSNVKSNLNGAPFLHHF